MATIIQNCLRQAVVFFDNEQHFNSDITSLSTWHTIDARGDYGVPNHAAAVIVGTQKTNTVSTIHQYRTDSGEGNLGRTSATDTPAWYEFIKLSSTGTFDAWRNATTYDHFIIGYLDGSAWKMFDSAYIDKGSFTTSATWNNIDITANVDTADQGNVEMAIFHCYRDVNPGKGGVTQCQARKDGATWNPGAETLNGGIDFATFVVPVTSSDIAEVYINATVGGSIKVKLVGYLRKGFGFTGITNPASETGWSTLNSWTTATSTTFTDQTIYFFDRWIGAKASLGHRRVGDTGPDEVLSNVGVHGSSALTQDQQMQYYKTSNQPVYVTGYGETTLLDAPMMM